MIEPPPLPLVLAALAGVAFGVLVTILVTRGRHARLLAGANERAAELTARLEERTERVASLETDLTRVTADATEQRTAATRLAADLENERTASAEKLALVTAAEQALREAFQALSADALKSNNQAFLQLATTALGEIQQRAAGDLDTRRQAIDELIRPIRESLDRVDTQIRTVETTRASAYSSLHEQVRSLAATQQQLHGETANLVRALRTPHVRGQWGEMQLRRVVELAGMLPHCDFREQQTIATDEGRRRPDLIVQLPGGRHMVVDSKAPILAYLDAVEATDEQLRDTNLKNHARQVRDHVAGLGAKAYWAQFQPSPELVVMFLPAETVFNAALQHDPTLIEFAASHRVVLASPTSLIALLYAVAHGWQQQAIADNVLELSELGRSLYDRLRTMVTHFEALRRSLDGATTAYNSAMGSLESRVMVAARRLKDLSPNTPELPFIEPLDRTTRQFQIAMPLDVPDAAAELPTDELET